MDYSLKHANERKIKKMYKSGHKKAKNKIKVVFTRILLICIMVSISGGVMMAAGAYLSIIERAPRISHIFELIDAQVNYNSVIVDLHGNVISVLTGAENRDFVPSELIPDHVKLAFIAIEDERFFEHNGIDLRAMGRALWISITANHTEGASTITQQVIKMKLELGNNTFESKLQEQVLALDLERTLLEQLGSRSAAKDYILEIYLNSIHLGAGYGVQAASQRWFNKDVWELTLSEAATLAAMTSNPSRYRPTRQPEVNPEYCEHLDMSSFCVHTNTCRDCRSPNQWRRTRVLLNMLRLGFITQDEFDEAIADNPYERVAMVQFERANAPSTRGWHEDEVIRQVRQDLMNMFNMTAQEANNLIFSGGLTIVSTVDQRIQDIVNRAYLNDALFPSREFHIEVQWAATIRNINTGMTRNVNNDGNRGQLANIDQVDAFVEQVRARHLRDGDEIVPGTERIIPVTQPQSAFVVMDHNTGHVVAIAGGRGPKLVNMGLNRSVGTVRQPGSVFKTFVFAAGLDLNILTAATIVDDVPNYRIENFRNPQTGEWETREVRWPQNWWSGPFRGLNTIRRGQADSMNVLTVKTLDIVGVDETFDYLLNFGFSTLVERDRDPAPIALGGLTHGVSVLEMTAAYAAIANAGVFIEPIFYTMVLDHHGNILLNNENPASHRVISSASAFILTDIMVDVIRVGTAQRARLANGMPAAGKTGTTQRGQDIWFAGYTAYFTATVWVGYDTPRPFSRATRDEAIHLGLWRNIMDEIHMGFAPRSFAIPVGVEEHRICTASGLRPIEGVCGHGASFFTVRNEWFEIGTEPGRDEFCNVCVVVDVCTGTGSEWFIPGSFCTDHTVIRNFIGIVRPIPFTGNANVRDARYEIPIYHCTVCTPQSQHTQPVHVQPPPGQ
ncbi:MAG: transglycosylase domain-containing protein [Defluviitaleaceae bacterium]|nr:transglycosylase domain-containing protein [Defluviitaleaceae bacterium]